MATGPLHEAKLPQLLSSATPRCLTCKTALNNTTDRKKKTHNWWTNCLSCRTKNTIRQRHRRDTGLLGARTLSDTESRQDLGGGRTKFPRNLAVLTKDVAVKPLKLHPGPDHINGPVTCWKEKEKHVPCPDCFQTISKPWIASCGQLLCCHGRSSSSVADAGSYHATCIACEETSAASKSHDQNKELSRSRKRFKLDCPAYKASRRPLSKECSVCMDDILEEDFATLSGCEHVSDVCRDCFSKWLDSQLGSTPWEKIRCPTNGCEQAITHHDVRQIASKDVFRRFDELSMRAFLSADPSSRYCLAEGCTSGQIHDTGFEGNIFRCNACNFRVCTVHDVPFHTNETCAKYDERRRKEEEEKRQRHRDREAQNELSMAEIKASTTKCPGCEVPIHKYEACDHITCARCNFEFCYICRAPYRGQHGIFLVGNTVHTNECKYHPKHLPDYRVPEPEDATPETVTEAAGIDGEIHFEAPDTEDQIDYSEEDPEEFNARVDSIVSAGLRSMSPV